MSFDETTALPDPGSSTLEVSALADQASGVSMSVKRVSGMVGGVAELLSQTSGELATYESTVLDARGVSTRLQGEMKSLLTLAQQVTVALGLIEHVAMQTRMLAFNATLESARAGEQGRGLAVVASAVKELSKQTNSATLEIREAMAAITLAATNTHQHSHELDGALGSITRATGDFVQRLREQAEVSHAARQYIDEAAGTVDGIAAALTPPT